MGCSAKTYDGITKFKIGVITQRLGEQGVSVSGDNPWDADTHKSGVKLHSSWDEGSGILTVEVSDKDFYVPCGKIWGTIDPLVQEVQAMPEPTAQGAAGPEAPVQVGPPTLTRLPSSIDRSSMMDLRTNIRTSVLPQTPSKAAQAKAQAQAALKPQAAAGPAAAPEPAASGTSKTLLYVAGGLAVVGLGWFAYQKIGKPTSA
jgi:hypothetical protein